MAQRIGRKAALAIIRDWGMTARATGWGDIVVRFADCRNKRDHGSFCSDWDEALSTALAMSKGWHCCPKEGGA